MAETAIRRRRFPVGTVILAALVTIGFASGVVRFALGLGATTNMTDARPWGFWVAGSEAGS